MVKWHGGWMIAPYGFMVHPLNAGLETAGRYDPTGKSFSSLLVWDEWALWGKRSKLCCGIVGCSRPGLGLLATSRKLQWLACAWKLANPSPRQHRPGIRITSMLMLLRPNFCQWPATAATVRLASLEERIKAFPGLKTGNLLLADQTWTPGLVRLWGDLTSNGPTWLREMLSYEGSLHLVSRTEWLLTTKTASFDILCRRYYGWSGASVAQNLRPLCLVVTVW